MASTEYTYTIATDTANGMCNGTSLSAEIRASAIVTALDYCGTFEGILSVWMKDALSTGDETLLTALVLAHQGLSNLEVPQAVSLSGVQQEEDKKLVVVQSPATTGWRTWFTGAGDQLSPIARGLGDRLRISFGSDIADPKPSTKSAEIQFAEPIEVHDGQGQIRPIALWGLDDIADVYVRCPATAYSAAAGTGNANAYPLGGGAYMLIPAPAADGDSTVVLANAVPIMAAATNGYWHTDHETGTITAVTNPAAPNGNCNLLNFEVRAYVARKMPIGNELGILDIDVYKVEWVHPNWIIGVTVTKASLGAGEVAVWLLCFRRNTTES